MIDMRHVCICGDCNPQPFDDTCAFEADLSLLMRAVADYRDFMRDVLHGATHPEMMPIVGALNEIEQRHPALIAQHRAQFSKEAKP